MYTLGATVTLRFPSFGASATLEVVAPDGAVVPDVEVGEKSGGAFAASYLPPAPGRYAYRFVDDAGAAVQDVFHVRAARSLALCSLEDVKRHANMTSDVDDDELREHIEAATGVVERHRGEVIALRSLTASVRGRQHLPGRPVVRVTAARRGDGSAVDVTGWVPDSGTGLLAVPRYVGAVAVDYVAGYQVVPDEIVLAAEIIAAHLWETQRLSSLGGAQLGSEDQYRTPAGLGYAIPNRAAELLGGRPPVFA